MTEEAIKTLIGQGVMGVLLVIMLGAIVYLQKKRDSDTDARIREGRESLLSSAETNGILKTVKDAVGMLQQSDAGLSTSILTSNAELKGLLSQLNSRIENIEDITKDNNGKLIAIDKSLAALVDRSRDGGPR